jgi:hypothetical protein
MIVVIAPIIKIEKKAKPPREFDWKNIPENLH